MQVARRFFFVAFLCLAPLTLRATLMTPLEVEELSQRAELILHGTVTAKSCHRSDAGRIYTRVEFQINEVWKGKVTTNTFTIVHSGGTFGNIRTRVSGQVEYTVGEETVAFLLVNSRGEGVTLGLAQGKFRVWQDQTTGEKFAHNIFHGTSAASATPPKQSPAAPGKSATAPPPERGRLTFTELASRAKGAAR